MTRPHDDATGRLAFDVDAIRKYFPALSDLLNADPDEVIFGRSMTALTFDLPQTLSAQWRPGDEVVVT